MGYGMVCWSGGGCGRLWYRQARWSWDFVIFSVLMSVGELVILFGGVFYQQLIKITGYYVCFFKHIPGGEIGNVTIIRKLAS